MKGGDILDKTEIVLELTKLISTTALKQELRANSNNFDPAKTLADTYNKIYDSINLPETTK